jgi:hypothetical protein
LSLSGVFFGVAQQERIDELLNSHSPAGGMLTGARPGFGG